MDFASASDSGHDAFMCTSLSGVRRKLVLLGYGNGNAYLQSWGRHLYDFANCDDLGHDLGSRSLLHHGRHHTDDFLFGMQQSDNSFQDRVLAGDCGGSGQVRERCRFCGFRDRSERRSDTGLQSKWRNLLRLSVGDYQRYSLRCEYLLHDRWHDANHKFHALYGSNHDFKE